MSLTKKNQQDDLVHDLKALLIDGKVSTQDDIVRALEASGHHINQSKISRLLRKVGAVKSKNESGQIVYRLPQEPAPPIASNEMSSLVLDVQNNETMIIVTTSPGAAQLIARMIDYNKKPLDVLGSIAGDDSIFVTPNSIKSIEKSKTAIQKLLAHP